MASNSKKRRRVLGVSCILAALIIASSSFAWFTSKDEVTNRLTASANYGVSAIENYVPPKQFTPGQTVKKEEAVANTGSVDAFVKQTISADMKVSVEVPTVAAPTAANAVSENYLQLDTQAKFGSIEAGSTLAWAPELSQYRGTDGKMKDNGIINDFGIDGATIENKGFVPDVTGLYIFRRAIQKTDENEDNVYEYVGYYFVKDVQYEDENNAAQTEDRYYKLYDLKVPNTALDTDTDGLLKADPTVSYSRKLETSIKKVDMTFLKPGDKLHESDTETITDYKLRMQYSTEDIVAGEVANAAKEANAEAVYTNYQEYLDYLQGKTSYVPSTATLGTNARKNDLRALVAGNDTGLIDWDKYFVGNQPSVENENVPATAVPSDVLRDFSYRRLEDLKYGNNATNQPAGTVNDKANYNDAATDNMRTTKNEAFAATTAAANGLQGLYNNYSPAAAAYNDAEYGDVTNYDGTTKSGTKVTHGPVTTVEQAWTAAQNEADRSRQIINTGLKAATDLKEYYDDVVDAIGRATDDTDTGGGVYEDGLRLVRTDDGAKTGTNRWAANMLYDTDVNVSDALADLAFNIGNDKDTQINFATTSEGKTGNDVQLYMTADSYREARFKDVATGAFGGTGNGSQVHFIEPANPFGTPDDSAAADTLNGKWNKLVAMQKRLMLVNKKIEIVQDVLDLNIGMFPENASETNATRDLEEATRAKVALEAEKLQINADYQEALKAYKEAATEIAKKIKKMNELQVLVDAANKEYDDYFGGTYTPPTGETYATYDATTDAGVMNVTKGNKTNYGEADSPVENFLEESLKKAYGIAHRADAPAATYDLTHPDNASTNVAQYQTYSLAQTKSDIDSCTSWDENDHYTKLTTDTTTAVNNSEKTDVYNAPYYRLVEVDNMMAYRKDQYKDKKDAFDTAAREMALFNDSESGATDGIIVYINLGDVIAADPATQNDKWQYIGTANKDDSAKEFDFGYTSILGAGETSKLLIKSVEFDKDVTQDSFLDMVFDINVGVESAQVVYNGKIAGAEAARSSLSPIIPSATEYATSAEVVDWDKRADAVTEPITEKDPDPKATPGAQTDTTTPTSTLTATVNNAPVTIKSLEKVTPAFTSVNMSKTFDWKITLDDDSVYYGDKFETGEIFYKLDTTDVQDSAATNLVLS